LNRLISIAAMAGSVWVAACGNAGKTWPPLGSTGLFSATLKTQWRDDLLYYQLAVTVDSSLYHDSIPTKALLRLYDHSDFEVLNVTLGLTSAGSMSSVYANDHIPCPREREPGVPCYRAAVESAARWTLLPHTKIPDPYHARR
jgi:hypothetical protein